MKRAVPLEIRRICLHKLRVELLAAPHVERLIVAPLALEVRAHVGFLGFEFNRRWVGERLHDTPRGVYGTERVSGGGLCGATAAHEAERRDGGAAPLRGHGLRRGDGGPHRHLCRERDFRGPPLLPLHLLLHVALAEASHLTMLRDGVVDRKGALFELLHCPHGRRWRGGGRRRGGGGGGGGGGGLRAQELIHYVVETVGNDGPHQREAAAEREEPLRLLAAPPLRGEARQRVPLLHRGRLGEIELHVEASVGVRLALLRLLGPAKELHAVCARRVAVPCPHPLARASASLLLRPAFAALL